MLQVAAVESRRSAQSLPENRLVEATLEEPPHQQFRHVFINEIRGHPPLKPFDNTRLIDLVFERLAVSRANSLLPDGSLANWRRWCVAYGASTPTSLDQHDDGDRVADHQSGGVRISGADQRGGDDGRVDVPELLGH